MQAGENNRMLGGKIIRWPTPVTEMRLDRGQKMDSNPMQHVLFVKRTTAHQNGGSGRYKRGKNTRKFTVGL